MKITKVQYWKEDLELAKPYTIAYKTITTVENLFVRLETDTGLVGLGAGSPSEHVTGEYMEDSFNSLDLYAESLLLGKDVRTYQAILKQSLHVLSAMPAARAAIDIALHDLFAQYLGIPLVDFFGRAHKGLPTSVTIGILPLEETLEAGRQFVAEGFNIIKLKTGKSVEQDIETFIKLRETVGPDMIIRVDANQGYNTRELLQFVDAAAPLGLEFVEQPVKHGSFQQMLTLPEEVRSNCAADEDLLDVADAINLAQKPLPFGIYNIKLMKCGGIDQAMRIAGIAQQVGIDLMWGCNDESIISITAALHAALANPATRYLDLDGSFDLARDLVTGGFILQNGYLYTNDLPGLGLTEKR